jgi:hypothetical protein
MEAVYVHLEDGPNVYKRPFGDQIAMVPILNLKTCPETRSLAGYKMNCDNFFKK